jgi:hypothetical protein
MDGLEMVRGLMARGYSAHQAAALAGHALQESGGNPTALNKDEGANGLWQWRGSRWQGLQDYAKSQGKSPYDPDIQMDYVGKEMSGPEKKAGSAFLAAPDVASASAALKPYIRYGDDSAGTRLANANNLFTQLSGAPAAAPVGALASGPSSIGGQAAVDAAAAPVGALATAPQPTLAGGLGDLGKQLQGKPEEFAPLQRLPMAPQNGGQSAQIAAAIAKQYGFG